MPDENIKLDVTIGGIQKAQDDLKTLTQQINEVKAAIEKVSQTDGQRIGFGNSIKTTQELYKIEADLTKQLNGVKRKYSMEQEKLAEKSAKEQERLIEKNIKAAQREADARRKAEADASRFIADSRARQNSNSSAQWWKDKSNQSSRTTESYASYYGGQDSVIRSYKKLTDEISIANQAQRAFDGYSYEKKIRELQRLESEYQKLTSRTIKTDTGISNPFDQYKSYGDYKIQANNATQALRTFRLEQERLSKGAQNAWLTKNAAEFNNYKAGMQAIMKEHKAYDKALGNSKSSLDSFMQKFNSHWRWILAGGVIGGMVAIPTSVINTIKEIETAMAGMNQVLDHNKLAEEAASLGVDKHTYAQQKLNDESRKFIEIAAQYGESTKDIIEAGKLWGRLYKDLGVVNALTAQSAKLAVADNFSLIEANKSLEAAMFQYGLTANNATEAMAYSGRIVDVWTKLAHTAGASAQDLTQAVERTGSVAKLTGVDFEFLNAMIATAVRSTGRSGAEIGNMFKSVLGSFHSKNAIAEIEKLGVAVYQVGSNGQKEFRKAQDVLLDITVAAQGSTQSLEDLFKQVAGGRLKLAA